MRRLLATSAALCALVPAAGLAQDRVSWWDVITIDRVVQSFLNSGIAMIRTQMDLQYGDLAVDLRRSRITMSEIKAYPLLDWDPDGDCVIAVGRIGLRATPIQAADRISFRGRVAGLKVPMACFPEDVRVGLEMAQLNGVNIPRLTFDVDYGMPKSDAMVRLYAEVTDLATVDASADFTYFWFDGRRNMENPKPVWFLDQATLAVENGGAWAALEPVLPPSLTGETAQEAAADMLTGLLTDLNRSAWQTEDASLNPEQEAFRASAAAAWASFVADPDTLVLETAIDGDVFLDFEAMESDPREAFAALGPVVSLTPARLEDALPSKLVGRALGEELSDLSDAQRLDVGRALITGTGAPRNIAAGMEILAPVADAGGGEAALLMAEALAATAPQEAYLWALKAGAAEQPGAVAMLDRLEDGLPFAQVLKVQADLSGNDNHPGAALESIAGIREQAVMRMTGDGLARSYGIAAMWAMLAKAAGDPEAADILQEIDELVALEGAEARAAWAETEAGYADLAMQVWVGQDLPGRYRQ